MAARCSAAVHLLLFVIWRVPQTVVVADDGPPQSCENLCLQKCSCPIGLDNLPCSGNGECFSGRCVCRALYSSYSEVAPACEIESIGIESQTYWTCVAMAIVCLFFATLCSVAAELANWTSSEKHSAVLTHLLNASAILGSLASVLIISYPERQGMCVGLWFAIDFAFVFLYGILLLRTWRALKLNLSKQQLKLGDGWIVSRALLLCAIDAIILATFLVASPESFEVIDDEDRVRGMNQHLQTCPILSYTLSWVLGATKCALVIPTMVLGMRTRQDLVWAPTSSRDVRPAMSYSFTIWCLLLLIYNARDRRHIALPYYYTVVVSGTCLSYTLVTITQFSAIWKRKFRPKRKLQIRDLSALSETKSKELTPKDIVDMSDSVTWSDINDVDKFCRFLENIDPKTLRFSASLVLKFFSAKVRSAKVRLFGVRCLESASIAEIGFLLPQLVQSLKYEPELSPKLEQQHIEQQLKLNSLVQEIFRRGVLSTELGCQLYWLLEVASKATELAIEEDANGPKKVKRPTVASVLYRLIITHYLDFIKVANGQLYNLVQKQSSFVLRIKTLWEVCSLSPGNTDGKTDRLRTLLQEGKEFHDLVTLHRGVAHPLDCSVRLKGLDPSGCFFLKSNSKPLMLQFQFDREAMIKEAFDSMESVQTEVSAETNDDYTNSSQYRVTVTVERAANLVNADKVGKSDPFVRVECGDRVKFTRIIYEDLHPVWNETMVFVMGIRPQTLSLAVYDNDDEYGRINAQHDFLGDLTYAIDDGLWSSGSGCERIASALENIAQGTLYWAIQCEALPGRPIPNNEAAQQSTTLQGPSSPSFVAEAKSVKDWEEAKMRRAAEIVDQKLQKCPKKLIFKNGDSLLQDILALQLIEHADQIYLAEGNDMKITTYRIMALAPATGFIEVVEAEAVAKILDRYDNSLLKYLRMHNPDGKTLNKIQASAYNAYLSSLAASCVLSFILGIGDRHLDNIMLTREGRILHIDFGFLFGKDPKPYPPPFRLTPEMVAAFGGTSSKDFERFKELCCSAFNAVRRNSSTFIDLIEAMSDAGIPDLDEAPRKVIREVGLRLMLKANEEKATIFMKSLVDNSQNLALSARLSMQELMHKVATSFA